MEHFKRSTARDFKINGATLEAALREESSDEDEEEDEDADNDEQDEVNSFKRAMGHLVTKGAYQKSELASQTGHFENETGFFREFSSFAKCPSLLCMYYVETNWSGWTFLIDSGILSTNRLVWPANSE